MKNVPGIIWVEKDNVESLKAAILTARENKEKGLVSQINQLQKDYVIKEFDISKWVAENLALYQKYFG